MGLFVSTEKYGIVCQLSQWTPEADETETYVLNPYYNIEVNFVKILIFYFSLIKLFLKKFSLIFIFPCVTCNANKLTLK